MTRAPLPDVPTCPVCGQMFDLFPPFRAHVKDAHPSEFATLETRRYVGRVYTAMWRKAGNAPPPGSKARPPRAPQEAATPPATTGAAVGASSTPGAAAGASPAPKRRVRGARKAHFPCLECKESFSSTVALEFHMKGEHPGAYAARLPELRDIQRTDRRARVAAERVATAGKVHPKLDGIYHHCPCGRSYNWHVNITRETGGML